MMDRISHLPTTSAGLALGAITVYVLKSWGCQLPSDWLAWGVGAVPAIMGIVSK